MRINTAFTVEDLRKLNLSYMKEIPAATLTSPNLWAGLVGFTGPGPTNKSIGLSMAPFATPDPVSPRDALYAKTEAAVNCLASSESAQAFIEETILALPASNPGREVKCTDLDLNVSRLKGLFADLQKPEMVAKIGGYEKFKQIAAEQVELLAKDCREYVAKGVGTAKSIESGLLPAEIATVQSFNHFSRVITTMFDLPTENGMVYLDESLRESQSLDDTETGAANRAYEGISYSRGNRDLFMKYYPYLMVTSNGPVFLNALSHPKQLAGVVTRSGPMPLPKATAALLGLPEGLMVTHRSVSRLGESHKQAAKPAKPANFTQKPKSTSPVRQYYTYEDAGVTKVITLDKGRHFYVQLVNRLPMEIPAGVINNTEPVEAKYKMHKGNKDRRIPGVYLYEIGRREVPLTQAQHQKVLQHNYAKQLAAGITEGAVHMTHTTQGSLESIMNRLLNPLAARPSSNKSEAINLLKDTSYKDRIALMNELMEKIRPKFEEKQKRVEDLRTKLFAEFADKKRTKAEVEDLCRKEAKLAYRELVKEFSTVSLSEAQGKPIIQATVTTIDDKFDDLYVSKESAFAEITAARALFKGEVKPFHPVFKKYMDEHDGNLNVTAALENVSKDDRTVFDALKLRITDSLRKPGGFKEQLRGAYWSGVTQHLMDISYGPEGIYRDGPYIGREGLPKNGRDFMNYLSANAKELLCNPIQVSNRLSKNYAHFEFNVSPYHALPWPNLYRKNDLMAATPGQSPTPNPNQKPVEPKVVFTTEVELLTEKGLQKLATRVNDYKLKSASETVTHEDDALLGTALSDDRQVKAFEMS